MLPGSSLHSKPHRIADRRRPVLAVRGTKRSAPELNRAAATRRASWWPVAFAGAAAVLVLLAAIAVVTAGGAPDPTTAHASSARVVDIAVLVFREGLESILVLTAITASMTASAARHRKPIGLGGLVGGAATLATWLVAVRVIDRLTDSVPALQVQVVFAVVAIAIGS